MCGVGIILISTIISFSCVLGDGDYCEFTLSVLMSQFFILFWFKSRQLPLCLYKSITILFWFNSSQVKCIGSSLHGDDFTTGYSPTTWPRLSTTSTTLLSILRIWILLVGLPPQSPIQCYWWRFLYYVVSIVIMIQEISISCLLRMSLVITSVSYNDNNLSISWLMSHLLLVSSNTDRNDPWDDLFSQVHLLAPSLISWYNINNHVHILPLRYRGRRLLWITWSKSSHITRITFTWWWCY